MRRQRRFIGDGIFEYNSERKSAEKQKGREDKMIIWKIDSKRERVEKQNGNREFIKFRRNNSKRLA